MNINEIKESMILFVVFCYNFEFGTIISFQLVPSKIFSADNVIFVVIFDGWFTDCVLCISGNIVGGT